MALKQCEHCNEMVDEAKAFCPGCGEAFDAEETRKSKSQFEKLDNTVQLGQTMYNQMLSDMGLNISKAPDAQPKKNEVVIAAAVPAAPQIVPTSKPLPTPENKGYVKWLILAGIIVLIFGFLIIAAAVVIFIMTSGYFN